MPFLRLFGLAALAAFAAAESIATPQDQDSAPAVKRQSDGEATGCHAHGDTLFCIWEGEEWEVTSDVNVDDAPASYAGCHTHGASELHCDGDVSLALESESEHSHEEEGEHDHSESSHASESTPASEITEVSDCHGHGDELFCVAGGDEWEVSTEVNVDDAPSSYSGCHAHGEDALHCGEGDGEVSLTRAAATDSHEETTSSGEAVDCHAHAGVEHCVDASGNTVDMGCNAPDHDYDVPLRIGLLFVILVTSAMGVFAPIITERFTSVSMDGIVIVAMRQFGTGVVISTAIVHLFTHASLFFNNDCLEGIEYEATTGAILMAGLFLTFCIEYVAHRWVDKKRHMFERPRAVAQTAGQKDASDANISDADSNEHQYSPASLTLNTSVMEAGIIFHSILIGLTLVVAADSGFITLFIVILFHQVFEGFALGSRIAMIPCGFMRKSILGCAFAVTTPIGMAIGIGVLSSFNGNDPSTIIAIGTLNAFSAGILLWVGIAEMWFVEWFHGPLAHAGPLKAGVCFLSLVAGLVVMSVLGKWA